MAAVHLSPKVASLKPSASIAARQRVRELQAAGVDVVDFTAGEPDFGTPANIVEAAIAAMRDGDTHYVASAGTPALKAAIVQKFQRENNLAYEAENIIVGSGAKQLIFDAFAATLSPGDEVVIPSPCWVSYPDMTKINDGVPVVLRFGAEDGFKMTAEALERAITPQTRWLILNSPNNPSGAVFAAEEMSAITDVLKRHPHVWVMSDDIYEHVIYDGSKLINPVQAAPELADRALIINGVSKAYAMTGWRIGYAAGPKPLIDAMTKLIGQTTTCASSVSQAASVAALDGPQDFVIRAAGIYRQRRDRMHELLSGVPGLSCELPAGAFYLYPSVAGLIGKTVGGKALKSDLDVASFLLNEAHVAVVDGSSYGLSPHVRLSFATSLDEIERGCERILRACERLF